MQDQPSYQERFRQAGCCVIIPTYNNALTLYDIIRRVLNFTDDVIVINDGSTDDTLSVLAGYEHLITISSHRNKGKGYAVRTGFIEAAKRGYHNAITIDSDGQHQPEDLPVFLDKLEEISGTVIIGARNLSQDGIPGGTTFGNRFSNFWFWIETGIKLPDTQSGFRLYPAKLFRKTRFLTNRFEFEIEVLVRAAWKGIPILSVPVSVYYPPKKERVSHFRPFIDFARISLLNAVLVLSALLFVRPWMFVRSFNRENIRLFVRKYMLGPEESNFTKAASVALGVFMGFAPVWGWQMAITLALSILLKLNKVITLVAANISIPPMIPVILFVSYVTGGFVLGTNRDIAFHSGITMEFVRNNLIQYVVGAVILGAVLGLLSGLLTYLLLIIFRKKKIPESYNAIEGIVDKQ